MRWKHLDFCFSSSNKQMGVVPSSLPWTWEVPPSSDHGDRPRQLRRCWPRLCPAVKPAAAYLQTSYFMRKRNSCYFKPLLVGFSVAITLIYCHHPDTRAANTSARIFSGLFWRTHGRTIFWIIKRLLPPNTCYPMFYTPHSGLLQVLSKRANKYSTQI